MAKGDRQMRALLRGASDKITGPKLTANVRRASAVHCPKTGQLQDRTTDTFRKMEARFAPR